MGLFRNRKSKSNTETRQFMPYLSEYFNSGLFVGDLNPTVDSVVSLISNTIAILPMKLYTYTKTGFQEIWSSDLARLLKDPAVEETNTLFWKTVVRHMLLKGNAYIFIHRFSDGTPSALEIIDPKVVIVTRTESGRKLFNINGGSRGGVYTDRDVIHLVAPDEGYNGTIGRSPVDIHRDVIKRNFIISDFISLYFNNSMPSRLMVTLGESFKPGSPKMEQLVQQFSEYFNKFVLGQQNLGRPLITPPDSKISMIEAGSNVQSDVLKLYEQSCAEVSRIFNCPYELIDGQRSKYGNLEQKQQDFLHVCIQPLCQHISETFEKSLVDIPSQFIKFDYTTMLETDQNKKLEYYQKAFHGGIMTLAEVRNALNLRTYDDETANNTLIVPANLTPFNEETINAAMAKSKSIMADMGTSNDSAENEENKQLEHNPSGDNKE